ncbi:MAG: hypothetical protein J5669_08090 [Bacteroidales bacterium]|nr:hypothetical protein [Bacteroidales bacterium]
METQYFLISTSHLETKIWFQDNNDYKAGMNLVAVAAYVCRIRILDFILMSNHVHFVVQSSMEEARRFIDYFKLLYSKYLHNKYGYDKYLRSNNSDIMEIDPFGESLERAIAYVHMNCVAANICVYPSQYLWGCGSLLFSQSPGSLGTSLGTMSQRTQRKLLHSRISLPPHYQVLPEGYVSPESYIPVKDIEALFRTPKRLLFFLNNSSKAKNRLSEEAMPSFRDQVILAGVADLCHTLFRKSCLEELSIEEKTELLKQLRYRFSADIAQLSRVTGISYPEACQLLDSF